MDTRGAEGLFARALSGKASFPRPRPPPSPRSLALCLSTFQSFSRFQFHLRAIAGPEPTESLSGRGKTMTSLLAITLSLLFAHQALQHASGGLPPEWLRNNEANTDNNSQTVASSSEEAFGSIYLPDGNLDQVHDPYLNETEEGSSEGPISTPLTRMIAINSSSKISDALEETNETLTQEKATNISVPDPEIKDQGNANYTRTTQEPETSTTETTVYETGSGYFPADDIPVNVTTKGPITITEVVYNQTAYKTPVNTTVVAPPAFREKETPALPDSKEAGNLSFEVRENSERGSSSETVADVTENKKDQPWAVVLVVGIVIGVIALGSFIFLNRKNKRDFSHRKLMEETSPEPVLRLDNSEPLDLRFGQGFGYYNAGLQGDNIQMTNFPHGRSK
ncbi:hypothetical protein DNTS_006697 [Danionella cerebrum]|uniref:Uncharacterized protein n=1 Tax=Danionella cerebrum TaxID=2873325 RepID=A0A553PWL4_9TELE|nr:hypothetical protein DNTS_006697 [Danionella translucida]